MPQHVLVVTLGPVQDFIASARRCQDLWFGSWLLSDLSRAVAVTIDELAKDALIFPSAPRNEKVAVANKILALLPLECDPKIVAEAGRKALNDRLDELTKQIFKSVPLSGEYSDLALAQIAEVIEYIWAAAPIVSDDYAEARAMAERLLGARKNTKNWGAVKLDGAGRVKCSIDGARESVIPESVYREKKPPPATFFVKKSERLCGVCLLKRVGEEVNIDSKPAKKMTFHSNSHVAAGPVFARVAALKDAGKDAGMNAAKHYAEALADIGIEFGRFPHLRREPGIEGYLLFEDRLPDAFESYAPESEYSAKTEKERTRIVEKARAALGKFLGDIGHEGPTTAYYAMLLADGDHMGDAIKELATKEDHKLLSSALETFALGCGDIVKEHDGSFIYSGGDDVLALLPLHKALHCANKLQESFRKTITEQVPTLKTIPTLSVGLGIAHHLEAMTEVRALAKDAEKLAKVKRNSLAIVVSKRSGGTTEVTGKWKGEAGSPLHERIEKWCTLLAAELLPDGVAFELEEAVAPFEIGDDEEKAKRCHDAELRDVIRALVKRILGRKRAQRGNTKLDADTLALLQPAFGEELDPVDEVKRLSAELQIARLFLAAHLSAGSKVRQ